jgi:hypothetical protein
MAVPIRTKTGPSTGVPAEAIAGGQVIEGRASGRVGVAGAASVKVLGIAITDGIAPESQVLTSTVVGGRAVLNAAQLPTVISYADRGQEVPCVYAAVAAYGEKLIAAAGGKVTPAGATPDARTIVGTCTEPNGVTVVNAVGLVRTV